MVHEIQPSFPDPTIRWRQTLSHNEQLAQISWTLGPENLYCQIKYEGFKLPEKFASTLHMMSRKVQTNLSLPQREWKEDINVQMYNNIPHSTVN